MLKPALARGDLQLVGATTLDEYRLHVEKDAALARRFHGIRIRVCKYIALFFEIYAGETVPTTDIKFIICSIYVG